MQKTSATLLLSKVALYHWQNPTFQPRASAPLRFKKKLRRFVNFPVDIIPCFCFIHRLGDPIITHLFNPALRTVKTRSLYGATFCRPVRACCFAQVRNFFSFGIITMHETSTTLFLSKFALNHWQKSQQSTPRLCAPAVQLQNVAP